MRALTSKIINITLQLLFLFCITASVAEAQTFFDPKEKKDNTKEDAKPIIKNPSFRDEGLYLEAAGSYVKDGAVLKVNGEESFDLRFDKSGALFLIQRESKSSPGKLKLTEAIPHNKEVTLIIINPSGQSSEPIKFSR